MYILKPFISLYYGFLRLFFDYDIGVYAFKSPKVPINKLKNFNNFAPVKVRELDMPEFSVTATNFSNPQIIAYSAPLLNNMAVLHNLEEEFLNSLKINNPTMQFLCVSRAYAPEIEMTIMRHFVDIAFDFKTHKAAHKSIYISHSLKTIEELLELEPYMRKFPIKKLLEVPVSKYPVKKEKFSTAQLESMTTRLAIEAKCKKYSMTLENIYDKFPQGLYKEVTLERDTSVSCIFENQPHAGELQILVTGKKKYDTQKTKAFIKYSELGIK